MLSLRHLPALGTLLVSVTFVSACKSPAQGCPDDLEFFRTRMWEPVMSVQCIACHSSEGMAAHTRMVLEPPELPGAVESNFLTVRALASEQVDGVPLLLLKPSGLHPQGHGGGQVLQQGSTRYADFQRFVNRVTGVPGSCDGSGVGACTAGGPDTSAKRSLRLLTRFEYDNTLRDLLYMDSTWGRTFPAEEVVHGFDNNAEARKVGTLLSDKLLEAAEKAAEAAVANLGRHVSCAPGDTCAQEFITRFGERAFRRPLTDAERTRYQALYAAVALEDGYTAGIQAVIATLLQSPHFLYRAELGQHTGGGKYALTDYEVASELSYLYWGSMPDEALLAKAREGALHTPEQIAEEARRLLASPRSRVMFDHFVSQWLELDRLAQAQKDAASFPHFTPTIRTAMQSETTEFFDYIVRQGSGRLPELFSANYTFASDALASFYGLTEQVSSASTVNGMRQWEVRDTGRGGILTHGSILASQSTPQTSSPVRRGKLVRERLLCQPLPPPPPGLEVQLPPVSPTLSNRERFREHSQNAACATCHQMMDPIGFGFEQFDSVGRYQPMQPNGQPVDASGEVLSSPRTNGTFTGVVELQRMLAESPDVHACFSLQWLRFAYGVSGDDASCVAQQLSERFQQGGLDIPELLVSLSQLPRFTERLGDAGAGVDPPAGGEDPGTGEPPPPTPSGDLQVTRTVHGDWGSGYCFNVQVTNTGTTQVTWRISLAVEGTLTDTWNATATPAGAETFFSGAGWNNVLNAGASAKFGYCANR